MYIDLLFHMVRLRSMQLFYFIFLLFYVSTYGFGDPWRKAKSPPCYLKVQLANQYESSNLQSKSTGLIVATLCNQYLQCIFHSLVVVFLDFDKSNSTVTHVNTFGACGTNIWQPVSILLLTVKWGFLIFHSSVEPTWISYWLTIMYFIYPNRFLLHMQRVIINSRYYVSISQLSLLGWSKFCAGKMCSQTYEISVICFPSIFMCMPETESATES